MKRTLHPKQNKKTIMISVLNLAVTIIAMTVAVAAVGAEPAVQRDPFPSTIPEAFGFNTHYWDFAKDGKWNMSQWEVWWGKLDPMAGMAKSGFTIHRSTVAWNDNEPSPGTYNWSLQDALMRENERCGLRPLMMLAYGHPKYDASSGPSQTCKVYSVLTQEGRDGFAAWARQVARRYKGKQVIYELWNEPNITIFWPKPDPDAYMALVEAAAPAIRAEDPTALICGGAMSPKDNQNVALSSRHRIKSNSDGRDHCRFRVRSPLRSLFLDQKTQ